MRRGRREERKSGNDKDVRIQNTESRNSLPGRRLNSEICILHSDIFAVGYWTHSRGPTCDFAEESRVITPGVLESRRIYTGKVLNLDVDRVRFPDGSVGHLEMIRHSGASAVVPFLSDPTGDDPQILLIKQYRYAANGFLYELPAGRLDPDEDPVDCARRELREETGCSANHVEFMYTMYTTPGFTDEKIHAFMAVGLSRGESRHETDEFITVETLTLSNALGLIEKGEIKDAKTALAILYAAGFRAGR
jgi:ADP-ribose pyrophosphatase